MTILRASFIWTPVDISRWRRARLTLRRGRAKLERRSVWRNVTSPFSSVTRAEMPAGHSSMAKRAKSEARERLSSVATAIRLLKSFSEDEVDIGISDLARRLRIAKSTAHRLAVTLVSEGLLEQDSGTGKY